MFFLSLLHAQGIINNSAVMKCILASQAELCTLFFIFEFSVRNTKIKSFIALQIYREKYALYCAKIYVG